MANGDNLTDKRKAFVSYYLGEARMNATKAAAMAGYKSPRAEGARLLTIADIQAEIKAAQDELRAEGITAKANRIGDYAELRDRLWLIINERGQEHGKRDEAYEAAASMFNVAGETKMLGGASGLLTRKFNIVGAGRSARIIEEHQLDTGLIQQLLNVDKQAAQELGEWSEKRQISGPDEGPIEVKSAESASEKLLALLAQDETAEGPGEDPQETR
jgi:Terminase small subunit.